MSDAPHKSLVDAALPFRFEIPIRNQKLTWSPKGLDLPETCRIPSFGDLAGRPVFADVRVAWDDGGIGIQVKVSGKRQTAWCRDTRPEASDGLHLWIDTRCSPGIHRATKFCHRFAFMPSGGGPRRETPSSCLLEISRARSHPEKVFQSKPVIHSLPRHDGYEFSSLISADDLTGFEPKGQPRIGLFYFVTDRELGWQSFSLGPETPVAEDPSLWGEAVLEPAGRRRS